MITDRIEVETAIVQHLEKQGSCTIEELVYSLPHFTFNRVFFTIDRLSREGKVSLRQSDPVCLSCLSSQFWHSQQVSL